MIAIEVSSAAGRPPFGGIPGLIRRQVDALLRLDSETPYAVCSKWSRWRGGLTYRPQGPNVRTCVVQDPFNGLLLPRTRLMHSFSSYLPRTPRVTKLATVYDLSHLRNPEWVGRRRERRLEAMRQMLGRADHVLTQSLYTASDVCDAFGIPTERVHAIPGGVDTDDFHPLPEPEVARVRAQRGEYVMAIGLLTPRKNFPMLVESVAQLDDTRLVVVGGRSIGTQDFFEAIERHKMAERVVQLENVPHTELVALINGARAFCVPSLFEGFGLIVLEAMACGTPVVTSSATSLPEVAADAALLVDARRPDEVAHALRRVLDDSELAAELRKRGLERARQLSWDASASTLRALYLELAGL